LDAIRRVPPDLVERAEAFLAGREAPAQPRPAATVVLLRSVAGAQEVYLLRRHAAMVFGGMFAFPGGAVDPRDADHAVAWAGPSAQAWASRMGCTESEARALVCAAIRETFEEAGVLLAGPTESSVVSDTTGPGWEADRAALVARSLAFTEFLDRRRLVLRTDLLAYWAHWITPEFEPRRFDTRFFVAVMPEGQHPRDVSGEADHVIWMRPQDAIAGVDAGEMAMLPPTYVTVSEVGGFARPVDVLDAARHRVVTAIMPTIDVVAGVPVFVGPWEV
jgi:8-oxo-dGTP pyrophosphatase MutT (NUDIX family)